MILRILIKGGGDLASGVAHELWQAGHDVLITELAVPLSVRRMVSFSRAVYDGQARIGEILAVRTEGLEEALRLQKDRQIPVVVDPQTLIRADYNPDVLVDAVMAKRNTGTRITDAPVVIALGPGFTAGSDCTCVIETKRGDTLGNIIRHGSAAPDTGIPGDIGGQTTARLLRASADGTVIPVRRIGDLVKKGERVATTGGQPVFSQLDGVVRGLLQEGVEVPAGLKIGDVDPRGIRDYCFRISDKALRIGQGALQAVQEYAGE